MKKHLSKRAHWEMMRASDTNDARKYCMKEETRVDGPWEFGKYVRTTRTHRSGRGRRTDIELFRDAIKSGQTEANLWDNFPNEMAKYPKMYSALHKPKKVREPPEVILLYGAAGTGKTKHFFDACPEDNWYITPVNNGTIWLDGYTGEQWVLFDDFSGNMRLDQVLRLWDRYPISMPIKGSHCDFSAARYIYVSTNIHPRNWYRWTGRESQYSALARRFTRILCFDMGRCKELEPAAVQRNTDGTTRVVLSAFWREAIGDAVTGLGNFARRFGF